MRTNLSPTVKFNNSLYLPTVLKGSSTAGAEVVVAEVVGADVGQHMYSTPERKFKASGTKRLDSFVYCVCRERVVGIGMGIVQ